MVLEALGSKSGELFFFSPSKYGDFMPFFLKRNPCKIQILLSPTLFFLGSPSDKISPKTKTLDHTAIYAGCFARPEALGIAEHKLDH
jgi:hypothetical protein